MSENCSRGSGRRALVSVEDVHISSADSASAHADKYIILVLDLRNGNILYSEVFFFIKYRFSY